MKSMMQWLIKNCWLSRYELRCHVGSGSRRALDTGADVLDIGWSVLVATLRSLMEDGTQGTTVKPSLFTEHI